MKVDFNCFECGRRQKSKGWLKLLISPPDKFGACITIKRHLCNRCGRKQCSGKWGKS